MIFKLLKALLVTVFTLSLANAESTNFVLKMKVSSWASNHSYAEIESYNFIDYPAAHYIAIPELGIAQASVKKIDCPTYERSSNDTAYVDGPTLELYVKSLNDEFSPTCEKPKYLVEKGKTLFFNLISGNNNDKDNVTACRDFLKSFIGNNGKEITLKGTLNANQLPCMPESAGVIIIAE
jgi:hypothetical protein